MPAQSGTEAPHHKCKAHYLLHLYFSQETARLSEPLHHQHQSPRLIKHTQGGPPSGSRPTRPLTALDLWAFRLRRHKYQATLTQILCCEAKLTSCLTAQYLCCEAAQISGNTHTHPRRIQARLLPLLAMAPALQPQRGAGHRSSRRCTSAAGAAFRRRCPCAPRPRTLLLAEAGVCGDPPRAGPHSRRVPPSSQPGTQTWTTSTT